MHGSEKTGVCLHVLLVLYVSAKGLQIEISADEYSSLVILCQMEVCGERLLYPLGVGQVLCSLCQACLYLAIAVSLIYIKSVVVALLTPKRVPVQGLPRTLYTLS